MTNSFASTVKESIQKGSIQEKIFAKLFGFTIIENQRKGTAKDFVNPVGEFAELKFDAMSDKTGNHFLELEQTNDGWETTIPSGFGLSKSQSKYWVVANASVLHILTVNAVCEMIQSETFRSLTTRAGKNGNRSASFSRGLIIPLKTLEKFCSYVIDLKFINMDLLTEEVSRVET